jgi:hypothetical protein
MPAQRPHNPSNHASGRKVPYAPPRDVLMQVKYASIYLVACSRPTDVFSVPGRGAGFVYELLASSKVLAT